MQVALEYVKKYGVHKIRLLTLEKNRGKGGAVRIVSLVKYCNVALRIFSYLSQKIVLRHELHFIILLSLTCP